MNGTIPKLDGVALALLERGLMKGEIERPAFVEQSTALGLPVTTANSAADKYGSPTNRAAPGSIVSVFGTGFGTLVPQPSDGSLLSGQLPVLQQTIDVFGPGFVTVLYAGPAPSQVAGVYNPISGKGDYRERR